MSLAYLVVTALLAIAALWTMTATGNSRGIKLCCALVGAGALVDVVGLVEAMLIGRGYAAVWPGELVLNAGVALLLFEWIRIERRQRHRRALREAGSHPGGPGAG